MVAIPFVICTLTTTGIAPMLKKDAGILVRKKYRIRICNFGTNSINLERKKKVDTYILKEDAPLTVEEVYKSIDGDYDFLLKSPFIDPEKMVFEVKHTEYLPKIVQSGFPGKADMMAVSKYVLAYEKF